MKKLYFSVAFIFSTIISLGQIKLPVGFRCVLGVNHSNESYFANGNVTFKTYPWGHDGVSGQDVIDLIQDNLSNRITFQKTKDNLFWGTGRINGKYVYIVLADGVIQFTITSSKNDKTFSDYCVWMLREIRREIATTNELYFTDYKGKDCFGMKSR